MHLTEMDLIGCLYRTPVQDCEMHIHASQLPHINIYTNIYSSVNAFPRLHLTGCLTSHSDVHFGWSKRDFINH